MSSNYSLETNASGWANHSSQYTNSFSYFFKALITVDSTFAVAGTLINVWFLAALLLSPEIRARIRNKVICGMLVVNLTEAAILCPLSIVRLASVLLGVHDRLDCYFETAYDIIYHIDDFLGNWFLVILLGVNTVQLTNIRPIVTPLWTKMLTALIFVTPCVFILLFVPLTMEGYYHGGKRCLTSTFQLIKVYISLDTAVPLILSVILLVMAAVIKCRRYLQGRSSRSLRVQLIDDESQVDPLHPFVAVFVTVVASDFCLMVASINPNIYNGLGTHYMIAMYITFITLTYVRLVFVPVMLLLFRDIRERIKIWRPCRRSALRADLVVTYQKNTS
ncbi:hypothetical protein BsWGS_03728 [Bradybaena similaris]